MKFVTTLTPRDQQIAATRLAGFLPDEIYDIHPSSTTGSPMK
jgi:hypothetical protein